MQGFVKFAAIGAVVAAGIGVAAARADMIRDAFVIADNKADYDANKALLPTFADLLKKGGAKSVFVGTDDAMMAITSTSVWGSQAEIDAVTGTADWKGAAGKLKYKTYTWEVFQLLP
jgi:hypothetical protein